MRAGMILKKIGMTHIYNENGAQQPITLLKNEGCVIIGLRSVEKDGYQAICVGAGKARDKHIAKPQQVVYQKNGLEPKKITSEFRVQGDLPEIGGEFSLHHFVVGQKVDVVGRSIGKGFAGAMKRHNFRGLRATHGVSISHRSHGSTGHSQDPGKVFKGKKMAGHMGARRVTVQNLEILKIDDERDVLFVKGAVPGCVNGWVVIKDAVKHPIPEKAPKPIGLASDIEIKKDGKKDGEKENEQEGDVESEAQAPKEAQASKESPTSKEAQASKEAETSQKDTPQKSDKEGE